MRTVIIGNAGSGKSSLARLLAISRYTPSLDLDTLVWEPHKIAVPRVQKTVLAELSQFCRNNSAWVIEGCYGNYLQATFQYWPELIFLDPGKDACLSHCRNRPWEPHKYASKAEQDSKLELLLDWVVDYYERDGDMSLKGHAALYKDYPGPKRIIRRLQVQRDTTALAPHALRS